MFTLSEIIALIILYFTQFKENNFYDTDKYITILV